MRLNLGSLDRTCKGSTLPRPIGYSIWHSSFEWLATIASAKAKASHLKRLRFAWGMRSTGIRVIQFTTEWGRRSFVMCHLLHLPTAFPNVLLIVSWLTTNWHSAQLLSHQRISKLPEPKWNGGGGKQGRNKNKRTLNNLHGWISLLNHNQVEIEKTQTTQELFGVLCSLALDPVRITNVWCV